MSRASLRGLSEPVTTIFRWRSVLRAPARPAPTCLCRYTPTPFATGACAAARFMRSEEHTSELQSRGHLVCRLLLEKKKNKDQTDSYAVATYLPKNNTST